MRMQHDLSALKLLFTSFKYVGIETVSYVGEIVRKSGTKWWLYLIILVSAALLLFGYLYDCGSACEITIYHMGK